MFEREEEKKRFNQTQSSARGALPPRKAKQLSLRWCSEAENDDMPLWMVAEWACSDAFFQILHNDWIWIAWAHVCKCICTFYSFSCVWKGICVSLHSSDDEHISVLVYLNVFVLWIWIYAQTFGTFYWPGSVGTSLMLSADSKSDFYLP